MSQNNFFGGFVLGTVVGGLVGGIMGTLVASRLSQEEEDSVQKLEARKKRKLKPPTEQTIEVARRGLEDKIAQLNDAIDDVRQQLGAVNGSAAETDRPLPRDS
jgi:gas vesicle protein